MIDSLEIDKFRCFEHLSVSGLGLVNIVVGESASGKTALLEAICLAMGGGPDLPLRFRTWRGLAAPATTQMMRGSYEALWEDLFYQMDQKQTIRIVLHGAAETNRILEIAYRPQTTATVSLPAGDSPVGVAGPLDSSVITPITLEWIDAHGETHRFQPMFIPPGLLAMGGIGFPALSAFYSSAFMAVTGPAEAANQFSALSKKKQDATVRKALKTVFPSITELSVENDAGNNVLYCSVPWMKEKSPVALVSSGINKLLIILLGIATLKKGVVLVDELENGIYYKTYPDVWKSLLHFCKKFDVQLFVSTHSMECLRAVLPALHNNEDKFRLLRCESKRAKRTIRVFRGEEFEAAMEYHTEVR